MPGHLGMFLWGRGTGPQGGPEQLSLLTVRSIYGHLVLDKLYTGALYLSNPRRTPYTGYPLFMRKKNWSSVL